MNLSELCIRRPVMTTLVMLSFVIAGLFGYRLLPVAALPRVDFPTIVVSAQLPGASPETMASSVAAPLERQFATIAGISAMTSSSTQGSASVTLQFDLDRDIDGAALDVQSALSTVARRLPDEMTTPPSFRKVNPADQPVLFLALSSATLPLSTVDEYAETLIAQQISTLPGVAQVQVFGAQKYAVRVQVNPETLAARDIGVNDIRNAIAGGNSNAPVGTLNGPRQSFTLQATGQLAHAEDYRQLIVAYRNGAAIRLGEIATVIDSVENDKVASWFKGRRAILLAVQRQPDANTVAVIDSIKQRLPGFREQIPPSVSLDVMNDRSISIRASVADVEFTLMVAIALVVLVIFAFLRNAAATAIPALALPVSIVGTFAVMYLLGYSIDNLSLLAITLSVGFIVDDAIVMLENIVRHIEKGEAPFAAAIRGSREIGFTILSMTLSLVAVFIPVLFMGGVVGRLFREFGVTISATILISGIVSLTLTPMLCSRILSNPGERRHSVLYRAFEAVFAAMLAAYDRALAVVLARQRLTLAVTALTLVASGYLYVVIPKGFFPVEDTGFINATTEGPQDIAFPAMSERQKVVADLIERDPEVDYVMSSAGGGFRGGANSGQLFIALKPLDERQESSNQVIQRLRRTVGQVPGINVFFQNVQNISVGGRSAKSQYQYTLQDPDLKELYALAPKVEARLRRIPGLLDVTADLQIANRQATIDIDRDKAGQLGITADDVRNVLYSQFGSRQVSTIYTAANDFSVILEADPAHQSDPTMLSRIYLKSSAGRAVPLDTIAAIRQTAGPLSVNHQSQQPAVTLSFNLAPGTSLGDAVERIHAAERELNLPGTLTTGFQGTAQVFEDSLRGQGLLLTAAVLVIYMVLGILYESFLHPLTILSGLPSAGLGALVTLIGFKMDLSIIAIIGVVMLIGIVKKNAIMMIDFAIERQRAGDVTPEAAIREACLLRFRPIVMTTMAAIMGTLPIALASGAGSELRRPLGVAVVGGLVFSQLLTLFITPVVYIALERLRARWRRAPEPVALPAE